MPCTLGNLGNRPLFRLVVPIISEHLSGFMLLGAMTGVVLERIWEANVNIKAGDGFCFMYY